MRAEIVLSESDKATRLLAWLQDQKRLTAAQLGHVRQVQTSLRMPVTEVLLKLRFLGETDLAEALAGISGLALEVVDHRSPDPLLLGQVPYVFANRHHVLPLRREGTRITVAIADPFDERMQNHLSRYLAGEIVWVVVPRAALARAIQVAYHFVQHPSSTEVERTVSAGGAQIDGVRLIRSVMGGAVEMGASDVHFSPAEFATLVYYRIDGVLRLRHVLPVSVHTRIVSALKIEAGMDIAETRRPLDGSFSYDFLNEVFDLRVSSMPTTHGENMVVRVLSGSGDVLPLGLLGFDEVQQRQIKLLLSAPNGIVLATGPTGSGKTTTLYSALRFVNVLENNVMTVEDPVEYNVPMIRQVAMNEKAGMTFAAAIRGFLRQDPDVMLVGEIRDTETATMAVRAAQTGHLVPATLHTNDAIGAVTRLRDLGVAPYMLSASLNGVIAQRLVRKLCTHCRTPVPNAPGQYTAVGCPRCFETGYLGRMALGEVLILDDDLREAINRGASEPEMRRLAAGKGLVSMREVGHLLLQDGKTDRAELQRVLGSDLGGM
jgi:type II secretory ATPase GspE/PulE/Tfp pilus assembly ATPase PilB-like protein